MKVPKYYKITVSRIGGPHRNPLYRMEFSRNDKEILFKCLGNEILVGSDGGGPEKLAIIERLLADLILCPCEQTFPDQIDKLINISVHIDLNECEASFRWLGPCPKEWFVLDQLQAIIWEWSRTYFNK